MKKKNKTRSVTGLLFGFMERVSGDHVGAYATQAAYFLIMSFIPCILFLTTLVRYTPLTYNVVRDAIVAFIPENLQSFVLGRRLEILKDSHAGAFAVITAAVYFIAWYGAYSQLFNSAENMRAIGILSLGFMVSRCLSGIGVITFPKAKADGTVAEFSRNSSDVLSRNVLIVYLVLLAAGMILIRPVWGSLAFVGALLIFWYYHHIAMKYFGGTTGDISGFFLCICEVGMALILAVVSNF